MTGELQRRTLLLGGIAAACVPLAACDWPAGDSQNGVAGPQPDLAITLAALEAASGARRLGVAVLDSKDGTMVGHRLDERFAMCSTFKLSLAAAVLALIDAGQLSSDEMLPITADDRVEFSPIIRGALREGKTQLSVVTLAEAAQVRSDNGAANILLRKIGGPEALTAFWRSLGDKVSRLDRYEPALNTTHGDDQRDTTTPAAMAGSMNGIFARPLLQRGSLEQLTSWTIATRTGLGRLRAGFPPDWLAGDKTGTYSGDGKYDAKTNDIAVVWHPKRPEPFFVTAYLETPVDGEQSSPRDQDPVLAQAGRIAADWIQLRV